MTTEGKNERKKREKNDKRKTWAGITSDISMYVTASNGSSKWELDHEREMDRSFDI